MKRNCILALLMFSMLLWPGMASGEETYSAETLEIANSLNCPVCAGQSVRDSNSQLARQMRDDIQAKLDAGETRQEILAYYSDPSRYGVSVLREPPKSGFVLALWWVPIIALGLGVVVIWTFISQRRRALVNATATSAEDNDSVAAQLRKYEERIARELHGSDQGAS